MKTNIKSIAAALLGTFAVGAIAPSAQAQVKGVSYTLSPVGEYVWWEKNTGVSDGFMVGGHLGFGFGEFVELRGTYLQSLDMKRNFGPLDFRGLPGLELSEPEIDVTRWGGDIKLNLSRGSVVPFLTAGTGVQTFKSDSLSTFKNIYVSLGGGLRFVVADRFSLGVQAVNTSFNASPVRNLMTEVERTDNGLDVADYENDLLKNWSVRASLAFYLGGRRPGELTDVDKAYLNNFSGGFSLPLEITAGQLDFDSALPYGNTKYYGAATGVNFGPFVGLRGYYWRAMDEDFFSSFDKLAIYGGEGKFKLSNGQGLTPSINVGGGVIDAMEGYEVDGVELDEDNRPFVSGGLGLDIPLGRAFKLTAYGKALLTSNEDLIDAQDPENLSTSWAYGLSANLILGNGTREVQTEKEESYDELVKNNMKRERNRAEDLKEEYQDRAKELDDRIKDAREDGNRRLANDLEDDREALRDAVDRIEEAQSEEKKANDEANRKNDPLLMTMKPTDYRSKIDKIEDDVPSERRSGNSRDRYSDRNDSDRDRDGNRNNKNDDDDNNSLKSLENRLKTIEQKLDDMLEENENYYQDRQDYRNNQRDRRNGNGQNRNNGQDYRDNGQDYRNGDDRDYQNQNYRNGDDRNYQDQNYRNGYPDNRNQNDRYDRQYNGNNQNPNYDDRANFNGNAGNYRGGSDRMDDRRNGNQAQYQQMEMLRAERQRSEELRAAYEDRIKKLENDLKDAKDSGDDEKQTALDEEMKSMQEGIREIREAQDKQDRANREAMQYNDPNRLRTNSETFRSDIDNVEQRNDRYRDEVGKSLDETRQRNREQMNELRDSRSKYQQDLEDEMDELRKEIRELKYNRNRNTDQNGNKNQNGNSLNGSMNNRDNALSPGRGNNMMDTDSSTARLNNLGGRTESQLNYESDNIAQTGFFSRFNYDGTSAVAGVNIGGATTLNIGVRSHYRYQGTQFSAMPEAFFGFGGSSSFGLFLNGIYDIKLKNSDDFSPYAGVGLGVLKIGDDEDNNTKLGFNIVLGANLFKLGNGRFYADYSIRNFFKYNQFSLGYRLPF